MGTVRLPVLPSVTGSLESDGRRKRIVPADVRGRFARARNAVFAALIGLWIAVPWIRIGGAPAVLIDIPHRELFLFGLTLNAQDTWLLFFFLSGAGFSLVFATALIGRAWCGWACPQTVFLEGVYRKIERFFEGPREKHIRRDAGALTLERAARKIAKHGFYAVASIALAHVILAYFVSASKIMALVHDGPGKHVEAFAWVVVLSVAFYGNFAWFREQLCVVLCPYGRLQSALLDEDSLVVGYDVARGEPRGKKGTAGAGDCVDCNRCVVVCPTGIDIRNGLQLDCIACTACIDACDDVMDRLGRDRGLIRYDSPNGLAGLKRRILRPRIWMYSALLFAGGVAALLAVRTRTDFEANVIRLPGAPFTRQDGVIRNGFDVHIVNKTNQKAKLSIAVDSPAAIATFAPQPVIELEPLEGRNVPLFLTEPISQFQGDSVVTVRVSRQPEGRAVETKVTFIGARQ